MKSGTGIKLISKSKTITSSYDVTNAKVGLRFITTVTNDPKEVMSWFSRIVQSSGETVIGLEVQYCRHSSTCSSKKPAILTLCLYATFILIIQLPCLAEIPDQLRNLFSEKSIKFVGANVGRSVAMLKEHYGINVDRYEDISDIVGGRSLEEFLKRPFARKVSNVMMELMIMRKTPEIEDATWEEEELDDDLVVFATLESYLSYSIGSVRIVRK